MLPPHNHRRIGHCADRPSHCSYLLCNCFRRTHSPAFFGSLQDLVGSELEYEASSDYLEDQAYWTRNLPSESGPDYRLPPAAGSVILLAFNAGSIRPVRHRPNQGLIQSVGRPPILRSSPRRAHYWCVGSLRRLRGGARLPGQQASASGVEDTSRNDRRRCTAGIEGVARIDRLRDFCEHVDTRIRELLRHQRFPVHVLEGDGGLRGPMQTANRVVINFVPSRLTLNLAGVPATATYTTFGPVGHFGLFFLGFGEQLLSARRALGSHFRISTCRM